MHIYKVFGEQSQLWVAFWRNPKTKQTQNSHPPYVVPPRRALAPANRAASPKLMHAPVVAHLPHLMFVFATICKCKLQTCNRDMLRKCQCVVTKRVCVCLYVCAVRVCSVCVCVATQCAFSVYASTTICSLQLTRHIKRLLLPPD